MTDTAIKAYQKVLSQAEKIKNSDTQDFPEAANVGDYWRQGDLYITLLENVPNKCVLMGQTKLKLCPGTTQGSNHILDSAKGVKMYRINGGDALTGPVIHLTEERTITHPEHGNVRLPKDNTYGLTYQRAFAEELRRVLD